VAESWRDEQRQADMHNAWGDAWVDADVRRGYRNMTSNAQMLEQEARTNAMEQLEHRSEHLHAAARAKMAYERSLPPPGSQYGQYAPPTPYSPATPHHPPAMPHPSTKSFHPASTSHDVRSPNAMVAAGGSPYPSPDHKARLLAAETAAAEAMAALSRVQREVHGVAAL